MKFRLVNPPLTTEQTLQVGVRKFGRLGETWDWNTVGTFENEALAMEAAKEYKLKHESLNTTYKVFEL